MKKVLITGRAVHERGSFPEFLDDEVDLIEGDIRDPEAVARAVAGVDGVVHLAAAVGVGQSIYQLRHYVGVNDLGTSRTASTSWPSGCGCSRPSTAAPRPRPSCRGGG